jgi:hypothetical protein
LYAAVDQASTTSTKIEPCSSSKDTALNDLKAAGAGAGTGGGGGAIDWVIIDIRYNRPGDPRAGGMIAVSKDFPNLSDHFGL